MAKAAESFVPKKDFYFFRREQLQLKSRIVKLSFEIICNNRCFTIPYIFYASQLRFIIFAGKVYQDLQDYRLYQLNAAYARQVHGCLM